MNQCTTIVPEVYAALFGAGWTVGLFLMLGLLRGKGGAV